MRDCENSASWVLSSSSMVCRPPILIRLIYHLVLLVIHRFCSPKSWIIIICLLRKYARSRLNEARAHLFMIYGFWIFRLVSTTRIYVTFSLDLSIISFAIELIMTIMQTSNNFSISVHFWSLNAVDARSELDRNWCGEWESWMKISLFPSNAKAKQNSSQTKSKVKQKDIEKLSLCS